MVMMITTLPARLGEVEELINHVDKGLSVGATSKREVERVALQRQRLVDIIDLETDMIETDRVVLLGGSVGHVRSLLFGDVRWYSRRIPELAGRARRHMNNRHSNRWALALRPRRISCSHRKTGRRPLALSRF